MKYSAGKGVCEFHNYMIDVLVESLYACTRVETLQHSLDHYDLMTNCFTPLIKSKYVNIYTN